MDENSVDVIVTDPPYGYGFMGKDWDRAVPSVDVWKECLRVLKPGGFAFIMSAPRLDVQSEMAIRVREAGFNISFTPVYWAYASGFPKAMNISKAVDKALGAEREKVKATGGLGGGSGATVGCFTGQCVSNTPITAAAAAALDGSYAGFQPKPAVEVIMVAMKPLSEKTYLCQAMRDGKGVTWLDDCRIPAAKGDIDSERWNEVSANSDRKVYGVYNRAEYVASDEGRFPANLLVSGAVLDDGVKRKATLLDGSKMPAPEDNKHSSYALGVVPTMLGYEDDGQFSRYFSLDAWWQTRIARLPKEVKKTFPFLIVPKACSSEKNDGCEDLEVHDIQPAGLAGSISAGNERPRKPRQNSHPTVKPVDLMAYLVVLGSRSGQVVLDPFMGSGTTAIAARLEGRDFIGFELSPEYHKMAEARLADLMAQRTLADFAELAAPAGRLITALKEGF